MSPTLLEFVVAIVLVVVLWQIGVMIAPGILRWLGRLGSDIDAAADQALGSEPDTQTNQSQHNTKEPTNGTHR
ncbi:MAG TPA: hypothetical protein PLO33_09695 [Kouleothrix sp.]|uniref:hypothetical protein n=1 Tax=Kouleothrix sp. TaxID=2779161 RepID=UPI002C7BC46B|nr:hypothetical protein [Kouleothrix sp.]HRC75941.1 hypothetical protein [Kouleothrix sp.]